MFESLSNKSNVTVKVAEEIAPNLMLRGVADAFFDKLEKKSANYVIIDFKGAKSISRSFAHQYLVRKSRSKKMINEANMNDDIRRMFYIVTRQSEAFPHTKLPPLKQTPRLI